MKTYFHFSAYIFLVFFLSTSLLAKDTDALRIVNPPAPHISEEDLVSIVLEVNSTRIDYIMINSDMNITYRVEINSKRSYYCKNIKLHLGENEIFIDGYKDDILVEEEKQMVFFTSKVYKAYKYPPAEYLRNFFHTDTSEKVCAQCHDMSVNEVPGYAFEDISKSNCYQCHSPIAQKSYAHAPAVNWLCTSCHNGKVGKYNKFDKDKSKYTAPDPIGDVCFSCHKKTKEIWDKSQFIHEPVESGRCDKCHSSHSSENEFYLKKKTWELCTSCHKVDGSHITRTLRGKVHPTRGVKDPSRKGKDLDCVSCHDPHVSNSASLLKSTSVFGLCLKCHKK